MTRAPRQARLALRASAALCAIAAVVSAPRAQRSESLYSLIRDDSRSYDLKEARKLLASGKRLAAVELLRGVLRCSPSAVMEETKGRWAGLREAARDELAKLDPEARRIYERMVDPEVAPRLRGVLERREPEEITRVAMRYPAAEAARSARVFAGDLFLEEGRSLRALREFDLLAGADDARALLLRRSFGRALSGLPVDKGALRGASELRVAGDAVRAELLLERLEALRRASAIKTWDAYGGGLSHARRPVDPIDAREPFWEARIEHLDSERQPLNLFATTDGRKVFVNTGTRLYGLDLFRGLDGDSWSSVSHIADVPSMGDQQEFLNGISNDFAHSSALGQGIVVAPLQVPIVPPTAGHNHNFNHIPIMRRLPVRRLHAFEAATGRLLWAHYDPRRNGAPTELSALPLDVSGPPLVVDETLYVLTHNQIGTIALYLCAFDLRSGALEWKTLICSSQTEVNMFGNRSSEFAAPPLAYDNGTLYAATNLGLCFAARADDGSLRWAQEYPIIPIPRSRMRPRPRQTYWANNPPVVEGERVLFTPIDSYHALCLDTGDGQIRWRLKFDVIDNTRGVYNQLRWCLGILDGQAWFAGNALARVDMRSGDLRVVASAKTLGVVDDLVSMIPRPLLTEERIYFQSPTDGLRVLDHDGQLKPNMQRHTEHVEIGNMIASHGVLVTTRPRSVHAYYSLEELLARARGAAEAEPENPETALAYAELLAARPNASDHDLMTVTQRFRDVLALIDKQDLGGASPIALRAKSGLYRKLRSLAKTRGDLGREDQAREMRGEALALARELWGAGSLDEDEVLRLTIDAVRSSRGAARTRLLDRLAQDHGRSEYAFGGAAKTKVGLYVLIQRYAELEDAGAAAAPRQLAILREILLQYGDDPLPAGGPEDVLGRSFAIDSIARLVARHGEGIYEEHERAARALFESAGGDRGKLQVVLEQYPTSKTAEDAIVRLASLAADRGDLTGALEAFRYGQTRMARAPEALLEALGRAARSSGNEVLAEHLIAGAKGKRPTRVARLLPESRLRAPCKVQLQHAPTLSTGKFARRLVPERVEGFAAPAAWEEPLLLQTSASLVAFAPTLGARSTGNEQPRVDVRRPAWSLPYDPPLRDLRATSYGDVLVLPEERSLRGVSLRDGSTLWKLDARDFGGGSARGFVKARALASGLYGVFLGSLDFGAPSGLRFVGLEPRSGGVCFDVEHDSVRVPSIRNGYCFALDRAESGDIRMRVLDPLDPRDEVLVFDGDGAPALGMLEASDVCITPEEIFVRVSFESAVKRAGLYAWKRTPEGLRPAWTYECSSKRYDSFAVRGPELLLTQDFQLRALGKLHRIDRATGKLRTRVECGYEAASLELRAGQDLEGDTAGSLTILGLSEASRALLSYVDTREGMNSWARELPTALLAMPPAEDMPAPATAPGELTLVIPRVRETQRRDFRVERFDLGTARRVPSELGRKPWNDGAEVSVWNGMLLVRTRHNAWLLGDKIEGAGAGSGAGGRKTSK